MWVTRGLCLLSGVKIAPSGADFKSIWFWNDFNSLTLLAKFEKNARGVPIYF